MAHLECNHFRGCDPHATSGVDFVTALSPVLNTFNINLLRPRELVYEKQVLADSRALHAK